MTDLHDEIVAIVYKHLPGKHSQKRHGWRYGGGVDSARRSIRGEKDPKERAEYRKRAGMSEPKKVERKPEGEKLPSGWGKTEVSLGGGLKNSRYKKETSSKYYDPRKTGPAQAAKITATVVPISPRRGGGFSVFFNIGGSPNIGDKMFDTLGKAFDYSENMLNSGLDGKYQKPS